MKRFNKTKTALVIISVLGISAQVNAGGLPEALTGGKVSGEVKTLFINSSYTDANSQAGPLDNNNIGSAAVQLNYDSGDFNGFKASVGIQAGKDFELHDNASEDDSRGTITATTLYKGHLDYNFDESKTKTQIRVGRQSIVSPLLMDSGMYPMRDSWDGVTVTNKDIPNTTVKAAYITKWVKRYGNDSNGSVVQEDKEYDDPLYSVHVKNESIKDLALEAQYMSTKQKGNNGDPGTSTIDGYSTYYTKAEYKLPTAHPVKIGVMHAGAAFDNAAEKDTSLSGINVGTKVKSVGLNVAYTTIDDDNDYPGTLGHVPNFQTFNNVLINDDMFAGTKITSVKVSPDFKVAGLKTDLSYAKFSQSAAGISNSATNLDGASELALDVKYDIPTVKGLSTRIGLAKVDYDLPDASKDSDMDYARVHLNYKF
ncbi:OprD family outer membrane porin [Thiothrix subterranea]|uniref:OprD family outer membrane porin n=2 Tax=Thiothrix subterranea TaxID=2735563 RepID=A0AA51QWJ6_9GAMM|nr:OprD family outer membrane porin [Thiothrix subterranea]MDQ5769290.1 OprD family outer membrane porin [Thiothrix subterranea]WML86273.1 OprD family outer membrane porin [Thiothrix subterranea]